MKTTISLSAALLVLASTPTVLAQGGGQGNQNQNPGVQYTTIVTVTAQGGGKTPTTTTVAQAGASSSATSSAAFASGSATSSSGNQICIDFTGGDFHWLNTGSWGSSSGQGASSASQCFDLTADGGMFICESECQNAGDAATAKYTKLECTFGGTYENCDISLVDGFSLPLECTIPGAKPTDTIGGLTDLTSLTSCPTTVEDNTCSNANSYESSTNDVTQFFQNANGGSGGNYCVFQTCSASSDIFFTGTPTISCQVGSKSATKRDVDTVDASLPSKREAEPSKAHGHRHKHHHAHARGLKGALA